MSDSPANFSFPHRTPVFTALVVIALFAAFWCLSREVYRPHAYDMQAVDGVRTPDDRRKLLADHRKAEQDGNSYGWVDQKAGIVRLPIDQAIELTVRDHAKK